MFNKKESKRGELIVETSNAEVTAYFMKQLTESGYQVKEKFHATDGHLVVLSNGALCFVFALIDKTDHVLHRVFICGNPPGSWESGQNLTCFFATDPEN